MNGLAPSVPALRVEGVVKRFGATVALDGTGLEVAGGTVFGLLGPNGAGKDHAGSHSGHASGVAGAAGCIAVVAAFGFALSWIFAFVALTVRGAEAAQAAGFVVIFPLVFASSVFVPVATMPQWLQEFAKISPVTVTVTADARSLALFGTPASLGAAAAWIGGLPAVFIPLSVWRYRRMS